MHELYVNIGCGNRPLTGFVNIDLEPGADINRDVREGLPFEEDCVSAIYSEHFFEHLSKAEGLAFLRECRRVLKPGGTVRIAMPDLDDVVQRYTSEDWLGDSDLLRMGFDWVENRCEMINVSMREWGHKWLYNEEELASVGRLAGFDLRERCAWGESDVPALNGLEYRSASKLIMELVKPTLRVASEPLVSILIPAYNPRYFRTALQSALDQTYGNIEIIICDDSRGHEIRDCVNELAMGDPRVRYEHNETRLLGRENYAKCLGLASGEYVKFLNDDDLLSPRCVERLLECFLGNPNVRLATSRRTRIDEGGQPLPDSIVTQPPVSQDSLINGVTLANLVLTSGLNMVGEPTTAMFRREDTQGIRPHFLSFGGQPAVGVGDVALWLNLLSKGDAAYLIEPLSCFRIHPEQAQSNQEVVRAGLESWQRLRFHGNRLGFMQPHAADVLRTRSLGMGDWADTPLRELYPALYGRVVPPTRPASENPGQASQQTSLVQVYEQWMDMHQPGEADGQIMAERMMLNWRKNPSIHLLTTFQAGKERALASSLESLGNQLYKGWGLSILSDAQAPDGLFEEGGNIEWISADSAGFVAALNEAIRSTAADWVVMIDPGDQLAPHALLSFIDYINIRPQWRAIYPDSDCVGPQGERSEPSFHPDINVELLRSTPYFGNFCLFERRRLEELGGFRALPGAESYDAVLRLLEQGGEAAVGHIPDVLYHQDAGNREAYRQDRVLGAVHQALVEHLDRSGVRANVSPGMLHGSHQVEYLHDEQPLVSIIIPTKDRLDLLKPCVQSLLEKTTYPNYEVLVVDNNSSDPATLDYLDSLAVGSSKARVLRYPHPYNFSAINNFAAREARGEYLLLLNNDTHIVQPQWLERMMSHAQRPEVGVVGARLVFPNQLIQHAGVVLGMGMAADHPFIGLPMSEPGYLGRAQLAQNYSAVTAACLLTRREVYEAVGGLDEERFKVLYNDVDFCLRVGERGYKIVWTPYATVVHHGSSSLKSKDHQRQAPKEPVEAFAMFERWSSTLANDPTYNRNLCLRSRDMRPDTNVAAGWNADFHDRPRVLGFPLDAWGSGQYRVRAPLQALRDAVLAQVTLAEHQDGDHLVQVPEMARLAPDVILLQGFLHDFQLKALEHYRRHIGDAKLIYELDDLKTEMPASNPKSHTMYRDVAERLRRALGFCDCMIVSTEPLKAAYADLIEDIVVVPNRLERSRWGGLQSQRRVGAKPRVGWAGAQQHHGDLALMREVVDATADEVEWVFLGMCPPELRPHVAEFHEGVAFDRYPERLASLNLDLAVAPLEINRFNEAKSNLRLLEYGIMGWPVVCTDIEPYRAHGAPVTRVTNDPAAWIEAIRGHAHDLDAAEQAGNRLRQWVLRHWMLEDHLDEWLHALTAPEVGERHDRIQRLA